MKSRTVPPGGVAASCRVISLGVWSTVAERSELLRRTLAAAGSAPVVPWTPADEASSCGTIIPCVDLGDDAVIRALHGRAPDFEGRYWAALAPAASVNLVQLAAALGASAYVRVPDSRRRLADALAAVRQQRPWFDHEAAGIAFQRVAAAQPIPALSAREQDLLVALARGLTYPECASALRIRTGTVQRYVRRLYAKLGVCTKAEAAAFAWQIGLVQ